MKPRRRRQQDKPVRVVWRDGNDWSKVHYVGQISVVGMAAIALDRSVMLFQTITMCGVEVQPEVEPLYGSYIEGKGAGACRSCTARYANQRKKR